MIRIRDSGSSTFDHDSERVATAFLVQTLLSRVCSQTFNAKWTCFTYKEIKAPRNIVMHHVLKGPSATVRWHALPQSVALPRVCLPQPNRAVLYIVAQCISV